MNIPEKDSEVGEAFQTLWKHYTDNCFSYKGFTFNDYFRIYSRLILTRPETSNKQKEFEFMHTNKEIPYTVDGDRL